jgi:DNA-binding PadR family transcriptional regulator
LWSRVDLTVRRALINGAAGVVTLLHGQLFSIAAVAIKSGKFSSTAPVPLRAIGQPRTSPGIGPRCCPEVSRTTRPPYWEANSFTSTSQARTFSWRTASNRRVREWFDDPSQGRPGRVARTSAELAVVDRIRASCCLRWRSIPGIHTQYVHLGDHLMSVPHALLALLKEGPKYGLRLQNEFESRTGEVWPLNVGQVYTTLQRLERDGLVETDDGEGERSRKRYRITSAGAQELADWLRTPPALVPPPRDELVIKVLVALQIPAIDVHEILQDHRRHTIEVMQRYTQVKATAAENDVPLALVADAELFRLEAIVRWLDAADVRLKQQPSPTSVEVADPNFETTQPMEVSQ